MASITGLDAAGRPVKRGSTVKPVKYRARWRTPDGSSRSRTFGRRADAARWLTEVESSMLTGGYVERSAGAITVQVWAERWIQTRRGRDGAPLRPRTRALYEQLLRTHIVPELGAVKLHDLTPAIVRTWHAGLAGSTAPAKAYRLLRAMMSTAVDDELVARNPCRVKGAGVERAPERPLPTGDEVWRLADAIEPRFRALVLTAAFVGLRWGELIGLQRADVDLDARVVHVERQLVEVDGQLVAGPPKTAAGIRTVAVPPALVPELRAHLEQFVGAEPASLVFVGAKGAPLRRTNFQAKWVEARDSVGRPDLHLHDLRHYANTLAASAGASTRELMSRLGHSSPAAALRYQHATAERDQAIAERMNDLIAGTTAPPTLRVLRGA
jgi:integrase